MATLQSEEEIDVFQILAVFCGETEDGALARLSEARSGSLATYVRLAVDVWR